MESRDVQAAVAVILAGVVGFALATFLMNDDDDEPVVETAATTVQPTATTPPPTTTAPAKTTTTPQPETETVPATGTPTDADCIALWNRNNNTAPQAFLTDLQNRQAVRVNVGTTAQVPRKCLVTIIANDGAVYRFSEGAGGTFPYSAQPARLQSSALSAAERETDALSEEGGKLSPR